MLEFMIADKKKVFGMNFVQDMKVKPEQETQKDGDPPKDTETLKSTSITTNLPQGGTQSDTDYNAD
jgi:hypothetical protein